MSELKNNLTSWIVLQMEIEISNSDITQVTLLNINAEKDGRLLTSVKRA